MRLPNLRYTLFVILVARTTALPSIQHDGKMQPELISQDQLGEQHIAGRQGLADVVTSSTGDSAEIPLHPDPETPVNVGCADEVIATVEAGHRAGLQTEVVKGVLSVHSEGVSSDSSLEAGEEWTAKELSNPTPTPSPTPTPTPTPTSTPTPTPTPSATPTPSPTPTPIPSISPMPVPSSEISNSPSRSPRPTPSVSDFQTDSTSGEEIDDGWSAGTTISVILLASGAVSVIGVAIHWTSGKKSGGKTF